MLDGFPYNGHCDQHERRCGLDRRKSPASLEDLWGLFPEPPPDEPGQNL
jgi:hypothetical protein